MSARSKCIRKGRLGITIYHVEKLSALLAEVSERMNDLTMRLKNAEVAIEWLQKKVYDDPSQVKVDPNAAEMHSVGGQNEVK